MTLIESGLKREIKEDFHLCPKCNRLTSNDRIICEKCCEKKKGGE